LLFFKEKNLACLVIAGRCTQLNINHREAMPWGGKLAYI
jgi:hypothetical protein